MTSLFGTEKPQTFECHFCNKTSKTATLHKSGWICPLCSQYNGFNANGDYDLNIINEFKQNSPSSYCKPSNLPFQHITSNVFQSNTHFTPNTYIATSSNAPLCRKCDEKQCIIQKKLSAFDAGANSDYSAYTQYRQLLEDKYPICNYCKSQSQYRMNTINHNARLWQQYQDSLPTPDLSGFRMKSQDIKHRTYYCSSFIGCIINSMMIYVSFIISIIGLSTECGIYLNTPFDIIENKKCEIGIRFIRCHDVDGYWIQCLYIHSIKNQYLLLNLSNDVFWSIVLLLLIFISFDTRKYNHFFYFVWILSLIVSILISIIMEWNQLLWCKQIDIILQITTFILCLLCMIPCNERKKRIEIKNNIDMNDGKSMLKLLEQQDIEERTNVYQQRVNEESLFSSFNNDKWSNVTKPMNTFYGLNLDHNNNNGVHHEPMDVCNSPRHNTNADNNFNSVRNGIYSLDLNRSF